ncbi:hypothetical protein BGW39_008568 [Mortierella sp. 14UC]|nr:hypothetical protein BGW39_008568 [Mortierella sp. 14UC]
MRSGDSKRRKRSLDEEQEPQRIEKLNLFSRLLNADRLHRMPHRRVHISNNNNNNNNRIYQSSNNDNENSEAEEYFYWKAEEEEEGIHDEDGLERHGGIDKDVDDEEENEQDGRVVLFRNVAPGTVRQAGASTSINIEPFLHPAAAAHSSLYDDKNDGVVKEDSNAATATGDNDAEDDEAMDRVQASHPWSHQQHPSSSSKHHATNNFLKSQIWIVDEWDEDFEGVEDETMDDLIDWIDDLDHVRARSSASPGSGSSRASAGGSEGIVIKQLPHRRPFS